MHPGENLIERVRVCEAAEYNETDRTRDVAAVSKRAAALGRPRRLEGRLPYPRFPRVYFCL